MRTGLAGLLRLRYRCARHAVVAEEEPVVRKTVEGRFEAGPIAGKAPYSIDLMVPDAGQYSGESVFLSTSQTSPDQIEGRFRLDVVGDRVLHDDARLVEHRLPPRDTFEPPRSGRAAGPRERTPASPPASPRARRGERE